MKLQFLAGIQTMSLFASLRFALGMMLALFLSLSPKLRAEDLDPYHTPPDPVACKNAAEDKNNTCARVMMTLSDRIVQFQTSARGGSKPDLIEWKRKIVADVKDDVEGCAKLVSQCTKTCEGVPNVACDSEAKSFELIAEAANRFYAFEGGIVPDPKKQELLDSAPPSQNLSKFVNQMQGVISSFGLEIDMYQVRDGIGVPEGDDRLVPSPPRPATIGGGKPTDVEGISGRKSTLADLPGQLDQTMKTLAPAMQNPSVPISQSIPAAISKNLGPSSSSLGDRFAATRPNWGSEEGGQKDDPSRRSSGDSSDLSTGAGNRKSSQSNSDSDSSGESFLTAPKTDHPGAGLESPNNDPKLASQDIKKPSSKSGPGSALAGTPYESLGRMGTNQTTRVGVPANPSISAQNKNRRAATNGSGSGGNAHELPNWHKILKAGSAADFRAYHKKLRGTASIDLGIAGPHENMWRNAGRAYQRLIERGHFLSEAP